MTARDRRYLRYGAAGTAVVAGALCAAVLTNGVGNTIATVLIGGGLLAIVLLLLRDMGLIEMGGGRTPPPPAPAPPSNGGDPQHDPGNGSGPGGQSPEGPQERRTVDVRRPDRMRGQRRRLR
jgi:hypothetical protein